MWEYSRRNTSGLSLTSANKKDILKYWYSLIVRKNKKHLRGSTQAVSKTKSVSCPAGGRNCGQAGGCNFFFLLSRKILSIFETLWKEFYFRPASGHNTPLGYYTNRGPIVALILPPLCFLYQYLSCKSRLFVGFPHFY